MRDNKCEKGKWEQSTEYKVPSTKYQVQSTKCGVLLCVLRTQYPVLRTSCFLLMLSTNHYPLTATP